MTWNSNENECFPRPADRHASVQRLNDEVCCAREKDTKKSFSVSLSFSRCTLACRSAAAIAILAILLFTNIASAKPSQADVFKSIQDNVSNTGGAESDINPTPWICAGIGVIIVLALFSKRQTRQNTPKIVNHAGRLIKEIMKKVPLRPRELKQLKTLADEKELPNGDPINPLVLLLCPSIMIKSVNERSTKADRRTLVQVLRKMGIR